MRWNDLKALLETNPSWPDSLTDTSALSWVNDPNGVTRDRRELSARELYEIIDSTKFTDSDAVTWWAEHINTVGSLEVTKADYETATPIRTAFLASLKAGNEAAVLNAIPENVSRAVHAGLGTVELFHIEYVRTM